MLSVSGEASRITAASHTRLPTFLPWSSLTDSGKSSSGVKIQWSWMKLVLLSPESHFNIQVKVTDCRDTRMNRCSEADRGVLVPAGGTKAYKFVKTVFL